MNITTLCFIRFNRWRWWEWSRVEVFAWRVTELEPLVGYLTILQVLQISITTMSLMQHLFIKASCMLYMGFFFYSLFFWGGVVGFVIIKNFNLWWVSVTKKDLLLILESYKKQLYCKESSLEMMKLLKHVCYCYLFSLSLSLFSPLVTFDKNKHFPLKAKGLTISNRVMILLQYTWMLWSSKLGNFFTDSATAQRDL